MNKSPLTLLNAQSPLTLQTLPDENQIFDSKQFEPSNYWIDYYEQEKKNSQVAATKNKKQTNYLIRNINPTLALDYSAFKEPHSLTKRQMVFSNLFRQADVPQKPPTQQYPEIDINQSLSYFDSPQNFEVSPQIKKRSKPIINPERCQIKFTRQYSYQKQQSDFPEFPLSTKSQIPNEKELNGFKVTTTQQKKFKDLPFQDQKESRQQLIRSTSELNPNLFTGAGAMELQKPTQPILKFCSHHNKLSHQTNNFLTPSTSFLQTAINFTSIKTATSLNEIESLSRSQFQQNNDREHSVKASRLFQKILRPTPQEARENVVKLNKQMSLRGILSTEMNVGDTMRTQSWNRVPQSTKFGREMKIKTIEIPILNDEEYLKRKDKIIQPEFKLNKSSSHSNLKAVKNQIEEQSQIPKQDRRNKISQKYAIIYKMCKDRAIQIREKKDPNIEILPFTSLK